MLKIQTEPKTCGRRSKSKLFFPFRNRLQIQCKKFQNEKNKWIYFTFFLRCNCKILYMLTNHQVEKA